MTAAAADAQSVLREGALVADKYKLVATIGEGAMGAVWKAEHVTLGHTVAIKFLHGSVANATEPRARFEREAKLAARLGEASRHITRVMDHGVTPDGTPFLVMEYLQGEGLEVRLKRERRLPIALVAKITTQLSRALHVAHQGGVVHRDLKPANVFLCDSQDDGDLFVKLLDFGVAKATLEGDENQSTRAGALIGTPNYMSPEQITGEGGVDARSDLWALAAIVYRMAVGRAPFGSGALSELAMRIVSTEPPTPTALAPDLPAEFDLWVQKGLAKKADARFQSARELADSLAMVAGVSATGSTGMFSAAAAERLALQIGDSVGGLQSTLGHSSAAQSIPPKPAKSRAGVISIALVFVISAIGVGVYATRGTEAATAAGSPSTAPQPLASANEPEPVASGAASAASAEAPSASASVAAAPEPSEPEKPEKPEPEASAPAAKKPWPVQKLPVAKPTATVTATATATATVEAPPPPPPKVDIDQKSDDLWKKKDEM